MAKSIDNSRVGGAHTAWVGLRVPKSRTLFEALLGQGATVGAGGEKVLNSIAAVVDPGHSGIGVVNLLGTPTRAGHASDADIAARSLAILVRKTRAEDHEAAPMLADLAAQLGYHEPAAEVVPEPAPAPAPAPSLTGF